MPWWMFDFDAPENNDFLAVRELWVKGDLYRRRPDIIGFGGDVNYSDFVEAGILADLSSYQGLSQVKQSYLDILDTLEYIPTDGTFGLPWMANAAGVLYNRTMFKQNGWEIPGS